MTAAAQLPQILIRNSFNILGLSSSSALKEIRKRSQQLLQLAKIEEVQEFDIDIGHVKEFRNEGEIRLALERVSGIQDRLKEIFFWFEDHRLESRKALELISNGSYQEAIAIFKASGSDWLDKKNLALALIFHAFASSSMESFCQSLDAWKLISDSDDFWKFYEKHYLLHDELGTSSSLFEEFRSTLFETLSAKAVSFYHQTKNPEAIGACYSAFGRIGKTADSEILQPIILRVKKEMEELEKMRDGDPDNASIKKALRKIHKCFSELDKFELAEYSPLTVLKNDTAEKLRSIAVDIYNENADTETARLLINQSLKLAVSEAVIDKIESDKKQLLVNESWQQISGKFTRIEDLIEDQRFEEAKSAYLQLDKDLALEASESSAGNRIQLLKNYGTLMINKGLKLFSQKKFNIKTLAIDGFLNRNNYKKCIDIFEHVSEIVKGRLSLLNLSPTWTAPTEDNPEPELIDLEKEISGFSASLEKCELSDLISNLDIYLKIIEKMVSQQIDPDSAVVMSHFGAASCLKVYCRRFYWLTQRRMWKWIGWTAMILFYFFVIKDNDKQASNSNKSYKSSSYQTKSSSSSSYGLTSQEKEAIEWLDTVDSDKLKDLRGEGYSDRQIAQLILKKIKEAGYSDVSDYLNSEKNS